jgi:hypothetical protein
MRLRMAFGERFADCQAVPDGPGKWTLISALVPALRKGMSTSPNASFAAFMASHGRKLQEEVFLLPIWSV